MAFLSGSPVALARAVKSLCILVTEGMISVYAELGLASLSSSIEHSFSLSKGDLGPNVIPDPRDACAIFLPFSFVMSSD